jgi:hypothetical protein
MVPFSDFFINVSSLLHMLNIFLSYVLVSVWTQFTSIALSLQIKCADMGKVSLERGEVLLTHLLQSFLDFRIFVRQFQLINVLVHVVSPVIPVSGILGHSHYIHLVNELVSQLNWKTKIQIK